MLTTLSHLIDSRVNASDGEMGTVKAAFFDDQSWAIRYLVVETGNWASERRVLISPYSVKPSPGADHAVDVNLTCAQVKNSPDIDTHQPVSRQHERQLSGYYGYPKYWGTGGLWGPMGGYPMMPMGMDNQVQKAIDKAMRERDEAAGDVHLRDSTKVAGYNLQASDDSIGHVKDFVFDDATWALHYLVIDTRNWWPGGQKVLIGTQWIDHIDWATKTVHCTLTRDQVKSSPMYDPSLPIHRDDEARLHEAYGRTGYWVVAAQAAAAVAAAAAPGPAPTHTESALFLPKPRAAPGALVVVPPSPPPVFVYATHQEAEDAIQTLARAGIDVKKLSLVGKGYHSEEHPLGFYSTGDKIRTWGGNGAFWGGIWGLLMAPPVFFIPGLGTMAMAGPLVATLVGGLEGAVVVGGLSALGAAFTRIGVPKDQVMQYETALKVDKYVLLVHGDADDIAKAQSVLARAKDWQAA
jgi:hypothetical protein